MVNQTTIQNRERDTALMKRWVEGDQRAASELFGYHYGDALLFCLKYTKNLVASEDIVQDSFLSIIEKVSSEKRVYDDFRSFLFRVLRNKATDVHRKKSRREKILLALPGLFEEVRIENILEIEDLEKYLKDNLPKDQWTCLKLTIDGYSIDEIAEKMGKSRSKIKGLLGRARANSRDLINNLEKRK